MSEKEGESGVYLAFYKGPPSLSQWTKCLGHWAVVLRTWRRASHVELVALGQSYSSSAQDGGVRVKPVSEMGFESGRWVFYQLPEGINPLLVSLVAQKYVGKVPYDYLGLLFFVWFGMWNDEKKLFCSEFVALVLLDIWIKSGLDPFGLPGTTGASPATLMRWCERRKLKMTTAIGLDMPEPFSTAGGGWAIWKVASVGAAVAIALTLIGWAVPKPPKDTPELKAYRKDILKHALTVLIFAFTLGPFVLRYTGLHQWAYEQDAVLYLVIVPALAGLIGAFCFKAWLSWTRKREGKDILEIAAEVRKAMKGG